MQLQSKYFPYLYILWILLLFMRVYLISLIKAFGFCPVKKKHPNKGIPKWKLFKLVLPDSR